MATASCPPLLISTNSNSTMEALMAIFGAQVQVKSGDLNRQLLATTIALLSQVALPAIELLSSTINKKQKRT